MDRPLYKLIHDQMPAFTATERKAAHALLANYPVQGLGTVAQFADAAGVSSPTILRFVARLGLAGFADFQAQLRQELETQLNSPLARSSHLPDQTVGDPLVDRIVENVRETLTSVPKAETEALVRLLSDDKRTLHLIGGRFTDALARYMASHLRIVRPNVNHVAGQEGNWLDQLIGMGPRDLVLVFDIRRYQTELIEFANAAAGQGATIALVTDSWMSPIARVATHVLPARIAVPSPWDSSAALLALSEVLIAGVTQHNAERSHARMKALESLRDARDPQHFGRMNQAGTE